MVMQQIENLQPWARRALGGASFSALVKGLTTLPRHGFNSAVGEAGELWFLGGVTGALFPYMREGFNRFVQTSRDAAVRNPMTLRTVRNRVVNYFPQALASGYFMETLYSLISTPPVRTMGEYVDHMVTHAWRGPLEGTSLIALPLAIYGIRRQVGERVYNYGHVRGWW